MKVACQYCRFFRRADGRYSREPLEYGDCRFNPPTAKDSRWPIVNENEWCGKFERGKAEAKRTGKLIRPVKAPQAW